MPRVSVIIPTWNRGALIGRAIKSVLKQTFSDWELIIVDDGSQDDTEAVCRPFLDDSRVCCYVTANQGVSAARNYGIKRARSEWVAFLDSDDEWMPPKLEKQFQTVARSGDWICHTDEIWVRRGRRVNQMKKHQKHEGWIFLHCLPLCAVSPSSSLVHRSVLDKVGAFDASFAVCEDYDFWLRATSKYRVSLVSDRLLAKYGGHADQLSRKFWGMDRWRVRALHARLRDEQLPCEWKKAVLEEILHKTGILIHGYRNNGRIAEVEELSGFLGRMEHWGQDDAENTVPELPKVIRIPEMTPQMRISECGMRNAE